MAAGRRVIEIALISDISKLKKGFAEADASAAKLGKSAETTGGHFSKLGAFAKTAALGGVALFGEGLKKSVDAAKEAEVAQTKLQTQLKSAGLSWSANKGDIDEATHSLSEMSGFTNTDLQGAFTQIIRTTGNVSSATKDMGLAADLARAKNIDLSTAAGIVAKVAGGNTGILKRYGIALKDGATATEALGALQDKVGGQAKAYGDTTAGAQAKFKAATEELEVSVGKGLLPILSTLATDAANVVEWFQKNKLAAEALGVGVGVLGVSIVALNNTNFAKDISGLVTVIRGWTGAQAALDAVLAANPIGLVVAAVAALSAGIYLAYTHSQTFREGADKLFDVLRAGATGPLVLFQRVLDTLAGALSTLLHGLAHVPGFGWADTAADKIDRARDSTRDLANKIAGIPEHKRVNVDVVVNGLSKANTQIGNSISTALGKVDHKAAGGLSAGGLTLVGEQGPELVSLPRGSYVHTAAQTRQMAGPGGTTINFNGPVGSQRAARAAAETLAYRMRYGVA